MIGRRSAAAIALGLLATALAWTAAPTAAAPAAVPPPDHRVYMVTDSVGLGAKSAMPKAFPAGWQVTVDGTAALFVEQLLSKHVKTREATSSTVFGDYAIVAAGYNYPYWDPARFDRSIDAMVGELVKAGTKHVLWVTLREVEQQYVTASAWRGVQPYYWYFPIVNQHLRNALSRWPQLSLIDWASIADQPGLTADAIHLNTNGAAQYSALAYATILTAADRVPAKTVQTIHVGGAGGIPIDAVAASLNITVVNPRQPGYLTAWPCDRAQPEVSNLNYEPAQTVAAGIIVPLAADGTLCVYAYSDAHIVVDVTGSFTAASGFVPITPNRVTDTRSSGLPALNAPIVVHTAAAPGLPASPEAVVLSVTTVEATTDGTITVHPCDQPPAAVPSRSFSNGATQNLVLISDTDANGDVCIERSADIQVVVDVFGAFAAGGDVHPLATTRLMDTRSGGAFAAGAVLPAQVGGQAGIPAAPTGVMLNVSADRPQGQGYFTIYPCAAGQPFASVLNVVPNHIQANSGVFAVDGDGRVCTFTSTPAYAIVDVTGWIGAGFTAITPVRLFDSRG